VKNDYQSFFFIYPTDAQVKCLKNNFKIYIKTAPTHLRMSNALPDGGVTAPKHVGAVLMSILILFLRQLTCASVGE
jgi:hypothetical protein